MGIFSKLFSKTRKFKKLKPRVDSILEIQKELSKLSDDELKNQTVKFRERLANGETPDDILEEAFATVREASRRVLHMEHFRVQLLGGIILHQGRIAEMKTGEGKTLVATLPAYLNALYKKGVHIVTVNDYLAERDASWMGKIYKFLGMSVGVVIAGMSHEAKQKAYLSDIIYATNNELGFDYLRDNMVTRLEDRVQQDLNFAIIDEVDNILIDEARTPLIISGMGEDSSHLYKRADDFVKRLKEEDYIIEAKDNTIRLDDSGVEKCERFFNIDNLGDLENQDISHYVNNALRARKLMFREKDYLVTDGQVLIIDEFTGRLMIGRRYSNGLHQAIEAKEGVQIQSESQTLASITFQNYFRLYKKLSGMTGTAKTEENEFKEIYKLDVVELPTNLPVQRVDQNDSLYTTVKGKNRAIAKDIKECYEKGQPVLVGTITVDKSEELARELAREKIPCNVLNAKNHAKEAEIIAQAGKLKTVTIATNMAGRGTDIMLGGNPEYLATQKLKKDGHKEELISAALSFAHTEDEEVLKVKAEYQKYYKMFKKDTDKEKEEVIKLGGLRVIGTERHDSRRIDNQLRGRSGRQGDPGSSIFYISMEDEMLAIFGGPTMKSVAERFQFDEDEPIQNRLITSQIEKAQARVEDRNFSSRKYVLNYDNILNLQRDIIYKERNTVLENKTSIREQIYNMLEDVVDDFIASKIDVRVVIDDWDFDSMNGSLEEQFLHKGTNLLSKDSCVYKSADEIKEIIINKAKEQYETKAKETEEKDIDFNEVEKYIMLRTVDKKWIEHIDAMDRLKEGIGLRAYGNHDPIKAYAGEGYNMFETMIDSIKEETVKILFKAEFSKQVERSADDSEARKAKTNKDTNKKENTSYKRSKQKVGRNQPCPCGSGKKYKHCCGK